MFENVGGKLQVVAKILFVIGVIDSIILAIGVWIPESLTQLIISFILQIDDFISAVATFAQFIYSLIVLALCLLESWLFSAWIYGFGQIVENSDVLVAASESMDM